MKAILLLPSQFLYFLFILLAAITLAWTSNIIADYKWEILRVGILGLLI